MDESDDPGGDTAMFRAFVSHGEESRVTEAPANRTPWIVAGAVGLVIVVVVALLVL